MLSTVSGPMESESRRIKARLGEMFPHHCYVKCEGIGNYEQSLWASAQFGEMGSVFKPLFKLQWTEWLDGSYAVSSGHDWAYFGGDFFFHDESDAILFKLRWG